MMKRDQSGFTAVELLITLFVAAAFLIAAYQLFNVVIKDGGSARAESLAGSVAYDYMRRYSPIATNPCVPLTPLSNDGITVAGLTNVKVTVAITCPAYVTNTLAKIDVTLTYNTPQQTVKYATYVDGGSSSQDVTSGLVGWWLLNGDATTQIGSGNGTIVGATPTIGQNGQANSAYLFTGSSQVINISSVFGLGNTNATIAAWINVPAASNKGSVLKVGDGTSGYAIGMGSGDMDTNGTKLILLYEGVRWIPTTATLSVGWHHIAMTIDSSGVPSAYLDGSFIASYAGTNAIAPVNTSNIGSDIAIRYWAGSIDDARVYNRALSATEITSLYQGGAK